MATGTPAAKKAARKAATKSAGPAKAAAKKAGPAKKSGGEGRRTRATRLFPAVSFDEALFLARAIQEHGAGQPIRRLTLFEALNRSPDSGPTRQLITSSNQYGITTGGYTAETLA